jgi:hypothetical protein
MNRNERNEYTVEIVHRLKHDSDGKFYDICHYYRIYGPDGVIAHDDYNMCVDAIGAAWNAATWIVDNRPRCPIAFKVLHEFECDEEDLICV